VISSLVGDQSDAGKVWSYGNKGDARVTNSVCPVPTGLTEPGSSVIVAEVTYAFTSLVNMIKYFSPAPSP